MSVRRGRDGREIVEELKPPSCQVPPASAACVPRRRRPVCVCLLARSRGARAGRRPARAGDSDARLHAPRAGAGSGPRDDEAPRRRVLRVGVGRAATPDDSVVWQLPHVNVFKHFGVDADKNSLRSLAASAPAMDAARAPPMPALTAQHAAAQHPRAGSGARAPSRPGCRLSCRHGPAGLGARVLPGKELTQNGMLVLRQGGLRAAGHGQDHRQTRVPHRW